MQPIRRSVSLALVLALLASTAFAETASRASRVGVPVFSAVGGRGDLPDMSVSCIAQDAQGFVWFGTGGGLVRYDGHSFKVFAHAPFDPESLADDSVRALFAERGALWVGTKGGLSRLDLATERFSSYAKKGADPDPFSGGPVTSVARDGAGSLWVGTAAGLYRLDESTGRSRPFLHDPADPSSPPSNHVTVLKTDREGRLWIGGVGMGLVRFDRDRGAFVSYRARSGRYAGLARNAENDRSLYDDVTAVDQDPSGKLWLGRASGGVSLFDPSTGRFEDRPLCEDVALSICATEEGLVRIGTKDGGLVEYRIATGRAERYRKIGGPGSLAGDRVNALFRDRAGDLWIGTEGGGLCLLGRARGDYESFLAGEEGMPGGEIRAILADGRGRLWVGTRGGGLARRDPSSGTWRRYRSGDGIPASLSDDDADFLFEDGRGIIWAGLSGGLLRFDASSDRFVDAGILRERVGSMVEDPSGGLWLGTAGSGLVYWDRASGTTRRYRHADGRADSLSDDSVTSLGKDSSGSLWIGTERGLDRLECAPGDASSGKASFVRYRYDPAKPKGISCDSIRTLFLDSRKNLWIGTGGGGLMRYEPETDSFTDYTDRDGLPGNLVRSVLEDSTGIIWVSSRSGLARYDREAGRFRRVSVGEGAGGLGLFPSCACAASDGMLFFGSADGVLRVDPARFAFNDNRPSVVLVSVSSKGMRPLGAAALVGLRSLDLPRGEGSVGLDFSALDYVDPSRNLYSHRLEGFDADWSRPGGGHRAVYTNLPRGDYVFRVKASNGDGLWNEEGIALKLRVRRRAWASPPALVLYALLLAGGGYAVARSALGASLSSLSEETERLRAKLIAASAAIESAAIVDPLTGMPNKRKILEYLELALSRASQSKLEVAVLMVDIDHFKSYNDRFGKAAGDECLRNVATAVSSCLRRSTDVAARYGGEEFLVVMEKTSIVGALSEAETIRRAVEALGAVTVSVGCVSTEPEAERSPATVIAEAEKALMAAKMLGRNRTSV
jgi:diguanylate cyclase (GGDEF)-like protein